MNNTIFDDVFRTMVEKRPYLAVPLINEVFHTSYPEDRLGGLINRLIQDQRMEEIQIASTDSEKREQLYKKYGI